MAHPNEEIARRAYEAFANGDMTTLDSLIADDVQWHVSGTSAISGVYDGKQATFGLFAQLSERSGGTFSLDVHDIVADDDHTVALLRIHGEREGKRLDDNDVHVMHVEDGRLVSFWSFNWDQQASAAFWG
jgi:ketosteroid isomerase-like protein